MKLNRLIFLIMFLMVLILPAVNPLNAQAGPVLFFSDLTWGPKTGWQGSATKGAAVTIWGKNFGSANGSNKITACGVDIISNDSTYVAEWATTGIANHVARGLERITFWLKNTMTNGSGTISITVGGVTSNTLPFTITTGTIYFISVSDGDNSYNGLYSTRTGHSGSDGPFKDLLMFDPVNNPSGDGQYICYIKAGTYTTIDSDSTFVYVEGPTGGSTKQKALIAYPAEVPLINNAGQNKIFRNNSEEAENNYYTYSKLYATGGIGFGGTYGDYWRIIGNHFKDMLDDGWTGVIWVNASRYAYIYGNISDHNGHDKYKHDVYIKSQAAGASNIHVQYVYLGWNEFKDPYAGSDGYGGCLFVSRSSDSGTDTRNIYIHDNYFHGGNNDFIYTGDSTDIYDIYIYNNIFTGNTSGHAAVYIYYDTHNIYLYNNTFYNTIPGDDIVSGSSGDTVYLKNNIFYANNRQNFFNRSSGTMVSDHDLFYGASVPSGSGITITNAKTGNPLLVNPGGRDFHLQSTSPAIDAGTASVSSTVTKDYDGNSRPQGSAYDIGAYEYGAGGGGDTPPAATKGFQILP